MKTMINFMKSAWSDRDIAEDDKTAPYKQMDSNGTFLNVCQIDTTKLTKPMVKVHELNPTYRKKGKFLRIMVELPLDQHLCVKKQVAVTKECPYTIQLKTHYQRGNPTYEIGYLMEENSTKPEFEHLNEMKTLGNLIANGRVTYDQVTNTLRFLSVCPNCHLDPPAKCMHICSNEEFIIRHPQKPLYSMRDARIVKVKARANHQYRRRMVSLNRHFVCYGSENFQPITHEDPNAYYKVSGKN